MAAVVARLFGSAFSHVARHKVAYGLGAATLGGTALYEHHKNKQAQASEPAATPMPDPTQPQSMMA